jgi:hypothetical protein
MSDKLKLNVIVTEHGVNMGDHGQDVHRAVHISPRMTVGDLMKFAAKGKYNEDRLRDDVSVTIRVATPLVVKGGPDEF